MQPALFPPPPARRPADADPAARLLAVVEGLDLASADGRAGIRTLLAEIERLSPGAILQQAATIELRRVGWLCGRAGDESLGAKEVPRQHRFDVHLPTHEM